MFTARESCTLLLSLQTDHCLLARCTVTLAHRLMEAAKRYALDIADGKRPRLFSLTRSDRLESYAEAAAMLEFARAQVRILPVPQPSLDTSWLEQSTSSPVTGLGKTAQQCVCSTLLLASVIGPIKSSGAPLDDGMRQPLC